MLSVEQMMCCSTSAFIAFVGLNIPDSFDYYLLLGCLLEDLVDLAQYHNLTKRPCQSDKVSLCSKFEPT